MSNIEVLTLANVVAQLEKRIGIIEKRLGRSFHGNSGYTQGCRCAVCRAARKEQMRLRRAK